MKTLDELLSNLGCDERQRALLLPYFRHERLPRGLELSARRGRWNNLSIISTGYLRGYFQHSFEDYTLGILGPGIALPPLEYSGRFPVDIFLESVTRAELETFDIQEAIIRSPEILPTCLLLLLKSYDRFIGELAFWASLGRLPRGESRVAEVLDRDDHLVGSVPNGVLASATGMSLRHFVRIKNSGKRP
ncbi:hypothetical protein JHJ32_07465 [Parapedobacter sp. ISTM3]|uniref:hypothetical protein n=1 Tax=Parapedobacter sp. ISTM3 TaxID=2800130 RepID=UPI0019045FAC|nr:hypothetical protein [Parapedobacter sp. ISTM3]MBK1439816.1 hypothetical protein [Parapedobacter sp. ISTM3]